MGNPIIQALAGQQGPQVAQVKQMLNAVKNAGNPQAMLNLMAQKNPALRQALDYVGQSGGDPKKACYELAMQKGVNPDEIL